MASALESKALVDHQLGTYSTLRIVLACIGFALPIVVAGAGLFQCATSSQIIAGSLSDYYHRIARFEFLTARDLFVGGLLGAAACLYSYKGFSDKENIALNMAAVFAVLVAVLPTGHGDLGVKEEVAKASCVVFMGEGYIDATLRPKLHAAAAILFFLCLAYVSIWRSRDSLRLIDRPRTRDLYTRGYVFFGVAMALSPIIAALVSSVADTRHPILIFVMETVGVWSFCGYWVLKSSEMRTTQLDARIAAGEVARVMVDSELPQAGLDRALRMLQEGNARRVDRIMPISP